VKKITAVLVLLLCLSVTPVHASNWLTGWTYRKAHSLNLASGAGTGYQMKILVHYGSGTDSGQDVYLGTHSRPDFGDARFTEVDGQSLLNYWIESYTVSDTAIFWVKIPTDLSSSSQTIYIYYGKSDATTTSNGDNTFLFFDNFNGASLNSTKWTSSGTATESSGYLTVGPGGDSIVQQNSANFPLFSSPCAMRDESYISVTDGVYGYMGFADSGLSNWAFGPHSTASYYTYNGQEQTTYNPTGITSFAIYDILWTPSNVQYYQNGSLRASHTNSPSVAMGAYLRAYTSSLYIRSDWLLIRKYVYPEPTHGTWGSEETAQIVGPPPSTVYATPDYVDSMAFLLGGIGIIAIAMAVLFNRRKTTNERRD
jgi:hypothetical protein